MASFEQLKTQIQALAMAVEEAESATRDPDLNARIDVLEAHDSSTDDELVAIQEDIDSIKQDLGGTVAVKDFEEFKQSVSKNFEALFHLLEKR